MANVNVIGERTVALTIRAIPFTEPIPTAFLLDLELSLVALIGDEVEYVNES